MSKHPIGPWSETVFDTLMLVRGGPDTIIRYNSAGEVYSSSYPSLIATNAIPDHEFLARSGVNNGGPSSTPSSATLHKVAWELKGFSASATNKNADGGHSDFSVSEAFIAPDFANQSLSTSLTSQSAKDKSFNSFIVKQGPKFNGLTFLGEFASFKKDVGFISDLITGRHNEAYKLLVKNLLKMKKNSQKDVARVISDHWLQYQFGIVPDIMDMNSLIDATKSVISNEPKKRRVSSSFKDEQTNSKVVSSSTAIFNVDLHESVFLKVVGKSGGTMKAEFENKKSSLAHTFGVGIEDFVPSAWELLPYSWLVDYFTNLGDFANLASLRRGVFTDGWSVEIMEKIETSVQVPRSCAIDTATGFTSSTGAVVRRSFTFSRQPVDLDTYMPEFRFESPNLRQTANIAALATTKLIKPSTLSQILSGGRRAA